MVMTCLNALILPNSRLTALTLICAWQEQSSRAIVLIVFMVLVALVALVVLVVLVVVVITIVLMVFAGGVDVYFFVRFAPA